MSKLLRCAGSKISEVPSYHPSSPLLFASSTEFLPSDHMDIDGYINLDQPMRVGRFSIYTSRCERRNNVGEIEMLDKLFYYGDSDIADAFLVSSL